MATSILMLGAMQLQRHLLQDDLIEDCLRDLGLLTQTVPANLGTALQKRCFLWTNEGQVDSIKGACISVQISLLGHFSPVSRICVIDSSTSSPPIPKGRQDQVARSPGHRQQTSVATAEIHATIISFCELVQYPSQCPFISSCSMGDYLTHRHGDDCSTITSPLCKASFAFELTQR